MKNKLLILPIVVEVLIIIVLDIVLVKQDIEKIYSFALFNILALLIFLLKMRRNKKKIPKYYFKFYKILLIIINIELILSILYALDFIGISIYVIIFATICLSELSYFMYLYKRKNNI